MSKTHDDPARAEAPKERPPASFAAKLAQVVVAFIVILILGSIVAYALRLGRGPWDWTSQDWQNYLTFSRDRVQNATERVEQFDWATAKTRITDQTKALWSEAPEVARRLEERLGLVKPQPGPSGAPSPAPADGSAASATDPPELRAGLELLRAGVEHYRASPQDPKELAAAKKCFEEAQGHLEKAVGQVKDEKQRTEVEEDLRTCNRYLEDCRAREKA
jgi:hypothetical protein